MNEFISDPKGRPVYRESGSGFIVYEPTSNGYQRMDDERYYATVEEVLADYPDAVRHVQRRQAPNKRRHPAVHYRPAGYAPVCLDLPGSTLTREMTANCRSTTNVYRVNCRECLAELRRSIQSQLSGG